MKKLYLEKNSCRIKSIIRKNKKRYSNEYFYTSQKMNSYGY